MLLNLLPLEETVNGVVNGHGEVIADPEWLLRKAKELRGDGEDNAQDRRACA